MAPEVVPVITTVVEPFATPVTTPVVESTVAIEVLLDEKVYGSNSAEFVTLIVAVSFGSIAKELLESSASATVFNHCA